MQNPLLNTKIQFLAIIIAVVAGTSLLYNSPATSVIGKPAIGIIGLLLVAFVAFVFGPLFFKAAGKKKEEPDIVDEVPSGVSPKAVGRLVELKYGGKPRERGPSFDEMYSVKKSRNA